MTEILDPELSEVLDFDKFGFLEPIPDNDFDNALAKIIYDDCYKQGMAYFRAIVKQEELSERALALTSLLIMFNPAHYTVWSYRTKVLLALGDEAIQNELSWMDQVAPHFQKNYQVWPHRQQLVQRTGDYKREIAFTETMLQLDSKNYHVWSHRLWLVQQTREFAAENSYTQAMILQDPYNNSAWNHRYTVLFELNAAEMDEASLTTELQYINEQLLNFPDNQSVWNYFFGVMDYAPNHNFKELVISLEPTMSSTNALFLEAKAKVLPKIEATKIYESLANEIDPVHACYWRYLAKSLDDEA
ncbi:geranylgeranyltransferase I alpha subunit Cwp1 [Schizosaccharomyces japonicus yFS275]|uniref:Protein farnesyltransferase/geranylgeranyltransferase type-1 subunit alpha n=1 Tax=Schizosaccharomyces japonicus (strain yFS275 / FY16936) TaxID=402676 RepID=B6K847_SCHJY|nr:geranylgeranyltransferase I alpha subunit Cwp1 [Schizosaccharomyces japonicus yFS275]EEB09701.1 geranylgeranyltransferase I alpha subunit Cwp1 [Schizosaccharomyces japonicus yFS275]